MVVKRLVETYAVGDRVELLFADELAEEWRPGRVAGLQHPGVWVQTDDRSLWYVTNVKRIRALATPGPRPAAS